MAVRTKITSKGVVQESGTGCAISATTSNSGFMPYVLGSNGTTSTDKTLNVGEAGLTELSSSTGAVTVTMPKASDSPGAVYVFRATSAHAHVLTGSQESSGTRAFCVNPLGFSGSAATNGSKLALEAVVGSSVVLISDGKNYLVMGASGSIVLSGT